jgi:CheY-like chemotaxis protein
MARILVVEDNEALRTLCREELAEDGHSVDSVVSGDDALARLDQGFDLMILELGVDEMGGIRVLREGLRRAPAMPIVIHTAYPEFQRDFSTWSAAAFIVKSSDLSRVRAEVQRILQSQVALREAA